MSDRDFTPPFNRGVPKLVHDPPQPYEGAVTHLGHQFGGAGQRTGWRADANKRKYQQADHQAALFAYAPSKGEGRKTAFQAAMWAQGLESATGARRRRST
jgi:hypothetical protein